ncbi:MAG: HD domain-containing protein [Planctomycetota bacterium]|nr:HD domain-containing protein [Planctomycetota bacterium]
MITPATPIFAALGGAVTARRLYGADHRVARERFEAAREALGTWLAAERSLTLHVVESCLLGPGGVVECDPSLGQAVIRLVRDRGASSVRLEHGLDGADFEWLVRTLSDPDDVCPAPACVRLGHAHRLQAAPTGSAVAPDLVAELKAAVRDDAPADPGLAGAEAQGLERVAAGICMAVADSHGTMLELAALKGHDEYTFVHTVNVALLAGALAEACGLSPRLVHDVTQAALTHDVGKRVIRHQILGKRTALTTDERELMQQHPVEGARVLLGQAGVPDVSPIVAYEHHMHLDGTGYPTPARGRRPHLVSQIVQQADVFDALRTHRPYRSAMTADGACAVLLQGAGTKYDRALVDVFIDRVIAREARRTDAPAA